MVLAVILLVLASATTAYARTGYGNVNKQNSNTFSAWVWSYGEVNTWQISYDMSLWNAFRYGGGIQESYKHQIYGLYKLQGDMDQYVVGNINYHENSNYIGSPSRESGAPAQLYPPGWTSWGWSNNSKILKNYYPGGPDYVIGVAAWYGSCWWGTLIPNYNEIKVRHDYR